MKRNLREERISGETLFNGHILKVQRDQVRLPNGQESTREIVKVPSAGTIH
ncbi:MAG: hypothetical protein ACYCV0_03585 [Desulfitobacteriaceae bacterium]